MITAVLLICVLMEHVPKVVLHVQSILIVACGFVNLSNFILILIMRMSFVSCESVLWLGIVKILIGSVVFFGMVLIK